MEGRQEGASRTNDQDMTDECPCGRPRIGCEYHHPPHYFFYCHVHGSAIPCQRCVRAGQNPCIEGEAMNQMSIVFLSMLILAALEGRASANEWLSEEQQPDPGMMIGSVNGRLIVPPTPTVSGHTAYFSAIQGANAAFILQPLIQFDGGACVTPDGRTQSPDGWNWQMIAYAFVPGQTPKCGDGINVSPGDSISYSITNTFQHQSCFRRGYQLWCRYTSDDWNLQIWDSTKGGPAAGYVSELQITTPHDPTASNELFYAVQELAGPQGCSATSPDCYFFEVGAFEWSNIRPRAPGEYGQVLLPNPYVNETAHSQPCIYDEFYSYSDPWDINVQFVVVP
jgi:hypothetical protein